MGKLCLEKGQTMPITKQKKTDRCCSSREATKQPKERHIVSWSQEEDDMLREQIRLHGTDNWTIIASKFRDKTTRQCRRRWFTYLNSDFKKGGWSPEEDLLLCEAQKIFGNRWTEIAKVVSGRTDNAVKNRFSTLCKKRAKHETLSTGTNNSYMNLNNKRVILQNEQITEGISETVVPLKRIRRSNNSGSGSSNLEEGLIGDIGTTDQQLQAHVSVLVDTSLKSCEYRPNEIEDPKNDASGNAIQGTFLKKDDPKIIALLQQAELLSSLAVKINAENVDHNLVNAWEIVQGFLNTKESDALRFNISNMDFQLENFKLVAEDVRSSNEGIQQMWRNEESPDSPEYSTGSTVLSHSTGERIEQTPAGLCEAELSNILPDGETTGHSGSTANPDNIPSCDELKNDIEAACAMMPSTEFNSPLQMTPLFRLLGAGIPSPQFSDSERHFLLKTLGMESTPPNPSMKTSQPPPCKRALLHCL